MEREESPVSWLSGLVIHNRFMSRSCMCSAPSAGSSLVVASMFSQWNLIFNLISLQLSPALNGYGNDAKLV